jgi:hypothetical protein
MQLLNFNAFRNVPEMGKRYAADSVVPNLHPLVSQRFCVLLVWK